MHATSTVFLYIGIDDNVFPLGQALNKVQQKALLDLPDDAPWHRKLMVKHRRIVGLLIPAGFFHFCWWGIAFRYNLWHLFETKWPMTITMIFGSMIAGETLIIICVTLRV